MHRRSWAVTAGLFAVGVGVVAGRPAVADGPCRDFAYGNAGFAAGYSMAFLRPPVGHRGWRGGFACPPRPVCPPRFCGPCYPRVPIGRPVCGPGGWYGSSMYSGFQSACLATPIGGGATFFSGGIVPWPVPYAVPVPYGAPMPWLGGGASPATGSAARRASPSQRRRVAVSASPTARSRAARLVADGDRKLVESKGIRKALAAAASAYGRAAASAKDDPDIHLRHAIALAAAGRRNEAEEATGRAVALDRRLELRPMEGADPSAPSPLVARGLTILREIGADAALADAAAADTIAVLAERWAGRPSGPLAALASGASAERDEVLAP